MIIAIHPQCSPAHFTDLSFIQMYIHQTFIFSEFRHLFLRRFFGQDNGT